MGFRIRTIQPSDPADAFPDPSAMGVALGYPDGLIAVGGDLSAERLLAAYERGIFPWFNDDQPILWWSPDPRAVIEPADFHMSRSLARAIRQGGWEYTINHCFAEVIRGCGDSRAEYGTWITPEMISAYIRLHELGYAHSIESWYQGELAGGIYGIRLGEIFFGESMFSLLGNGSKVAISALVYTALQEGISLLDCQVSSPHLASLGMTEIPRDAFLQRLAANTAAKRAFGNSGEPPRAADILTVLRAG
jgi:leucyl/phenylalanyl-tRNA--protein transferase